MSDTIKNVFVSHHHKDDASVDGLSKMLAGKNYQLRNSSIRVKPGNQERLDQNKVSDRTIERLLRMKMRWAGQVIVIIGKETHTRRWVDWEIEAAHRLGKPIIGIYEKGLEGKVDIPKNLEEYSTSIVEWNPNKIINALDGNSQFNNPDGTPRPKKNGGNTVC